MPVQRIFHQFEKDFISEELCTQAIIFIEEKYIHSLNNCIRSIMAQLGIDTATMISQGIVKTPSLI